MDLLNLSRPWDCESFSKSKTICFGGGGGGGGVDVGQTIGGGITGAVGGLISGANDLLTNPTPSGGLGTPNILDLGDTLNDGLSDLSNILGGGDVNLFPGTNEPADGIPTIDTSILDIEVEPTDYSNLISNEAPIKVVYGQRMIGGHIVHIFDYASNEFLEIYFALCEGEIEQISDIVVKGVYVVQDNDRVAYTTGDDAETEDLIRSHTYVWLPHGDADLQGDAGERAKLGADDQTTADLDASEGWTSTHRLRGIAVCPIRFQWNSDVWTRIPKVKFIVKGKKIYDPRDQSTAYSQNPILQLLDYLRNSRYGCGIPDSELDVDFTGNDTTGSFSVGADLCDASITLYGSTTGPRWTSNAIINTSRPLISNLKKLMGSCGAQLGWKQGKYYLIMETTHAGDAEFDFTEDHIIGGISIKGETKRSRFNKVFAKYVNADDEFEKDEVFWPSDDTYLDLDNSTPQETTLNLGCITDKYRATNMCKRVLLRSRTAVKCSFLATSEAFNAQPGEIVTVTHSSTGWSSKKFKVLSLTLNVDGTVNVALLEHLDAIYSENTNSAYVPPTSTTLPDPMSTSAPSNISVSEELFEVIESAGVHNRITVTWDASTTLFTAHYEWQYKKTAEADSTYKEGGFTTNTSGFVDDLSDVSYTFRVRAVNSSGAKSAWTTGEYNVVGLTAIPADVASFSAILIDGSVYFNWSKPTDLDVKVAGKMIVKFQDVTDGSESWTSGRIVTAGGYPPNTTNVVTPYIKPGAYMAKWEDSTGNRSENSISSIIVASNFQQLNTVATDTLHSAFTGTYSNMELSGSAIVLSASSVTFGGTDETSGTELDGTSATLTELVYGTNHDSEVTVSEDIIFSNATALDQWWVIGLRDGDSYASIDQKETTGNWISDAYDLSNTFTSRVVSTLNFSTSQDSTRELIDELSSSTLIDDLTDWDTLSFGIDDVTAETWIRTTTDDPGSTPTWTSWQRFVAGDFSARAFQWKLDVISGDAYHQISINEASFEIDMPDLVKSGSGATGTGADTSVSFGVDPRYYSTPKVGVTLSNMATGDYFALSSESSTGFTLNAYNSGGSRVARNFQYVAQGY